MIEWFPERRLKSLTFSAKRGKGLYFFGFTWVLISLMLSSLPFFGIGSFTFGVIFGLCVNAPLLYYYVWLLFKVRKNDIGNGVPEKW